MCITPQRTVLLPKGEVLNNERDYQPITCLLQDIHRNSWKVHEKSCRQKQYSGQKLNSHL